jgi:dipeptidyl-peptidase-4
MVWSQLLKRSPMSRSSFPIEEVAKYPSPGNVAPGRFAFSPDDSIVTFLYSPDHSRSRQMFAFELKTREKRSFITTSNETTEENVSLAEALRRERQRQMTTGVTDYEWARKDNRVLVPFPDGLYIQDGLNAPLRKILDVVNQPALDPRFSPDGRWVSYVQNAELFIIPSDGGVPRQLTSGARGTGKTNGLAEFVAQEEMERYQGYWWSPDSQWLAFEEVDETHIPIYRILHQGKDMVGEDAQEDHRYPFAGQPNARVRLGVVPVNGGEPRWMEPGDFEYLARVHWMEGGRLVAQLLDRDQARLDLVCFDVQTGESRILLTERSDIWINLHNMFFPLPTKKTKYPDGFIWASERSGYQHLYLYDCDGNLVRQLTGGEWVVEDIADVDARRGVVYFMGRRDTVLESHLYAVSFDGGAPRRITHEPGMHQVVLDHGFRYFVDIHDSLLQPPRVTLRRLSNGRRVSDIYVNDDPRLREFKLRPPEIVAFQNRAGITLYGALYRPQKRSRKPLPAIIRVYGGPHAQLVTNSWTLTASMQAQHFRDLGYVVFVLDNRGSAKRGLAFEGAIKHDLGNLEVQDQVDGVRWLVDRGIADPARVGITGGSYGGYMAAMCLCRAPEVFKVALAASPVTDWDGYDTCYTERYMGTPQYNPKGYEVSSVMHHVKDMRGTLMLMHGLIDENVHFRHTARLINALIQERKPYSLLLFPDERHGPRRVEDRVFMEERFRDFFLDNL